MDEYPRDGQQKGRNAFGVEASAAGHIFVTIDTRTLACPTGVILSPLTPWRQCTPTPAGVVARRPGRNWRKDARCTRGDTSLPVLSRVAVQGNPAVAGVPAWKWVWSSEILW